MRKTVLVLCGLVVASSSIAQQTPTEGSSSDEAARQRERAIERCKSERGTDCETEAGLAEWVLQERSRSEAEAAGSRSINQTAPVPTPRPAN